MNKIFYSRKYFSNFSIWKKKVFRRAWNVSSSSIRKESFPNRMIWRLNRAEFTFVEHRDLNIESEINSVSLDFIWSGCYKYDVMMTSLAKRFLVWSRDLKFPKLKVIWPAAVLASHSSARSSATSFKYFGSFRGYEDNPEVCFESSLARQTLWKSAGKMTVFTILNRAIYKTWGLHCLERNKIQNLSFSGRQKRRIFQTEIIWL